VVACAVTVVVVAGAGSGQGWRPWPPPSGGCGRCAGSGRPGPASAGGGGDARSAPGMNRAAGRGRVLRPAARSLRANASVRRPGRSHGRLQRSPPSSSGRPGPPGWRGRRRSVARSGRLQFVRELPGCPADSHDLEPDIYVDHRMISTCIRFDSNLVVPYSPSRYPHGTAPKSLPPGSATSRSIALNSLFADRSELPLSCRPHDRDCSRRTPSACRGFVNSEWHD
jgi:hypothetical protein